ncbi:uncharacterized protein [Atheta coriaria]|uniref:uncharacterized protein n=1 Tax=Dalotia coriaria TaxID=877792 RepID=UPI0031F3DE9A
MRYEHIERRIEQQYDARQFIHDFIPGLADIKAEHRDIRIKTLLEFLKEHWEEFKLNHQAICMAVSALNDEAKAQIAQIVDLSMAGGFPIQKWNSNHPDVLSDVPPAKRLEALFKPMHENYTVHALGLAWQPRADTFHFTIDMAVNVSVTKRKILSAVVQVFDPLGFFTPVVMVAKIFIQELWTPKLGWDNELSHDTSQIWIQYLNQLRELQQLSIPRWLQLHATSTFEIHGFCDASQKAMAAVIYVRATVTGTPTITLMCSKTKVAPLKRLTIPRLELCAAVLLTRLLKHVIASMNWDAHPTYCWTDSAITYTWVNNHPSRWKEFVHNRVTFIQEVSSAIQWRFVPGRLNPADCATRGLTMAELFSHTLWWNGPSYLLQAPDCWSSDVQADFTHEMLTERSTKVYVVTTIPKPLLNNLFNRASSLTRLIRSTVVFDRAVASFKKQPSASLMINPISPGDLEEARLYWTSHVQGQVFWLEI